MGKGHPARLLVTSHLSPPLPVPVYVQIRERRALVSTCDLVSAPHPLLISSVPVVIVYERTVPRVTCVLASGDVKTFLCAAREFGLTAASPFGGERHGNLQVMERWRLHLEVFFCRVFKFGA